MLGQVPDAAVWAIFFLPLISLITIFFGFQKTQNAGYASATAIGISALLSLWCLDTALQEHGHAIAIGGREWLSVGNVEIFVTPRIDGLSSIMLVVATSVSFLVQIYSKGYMKGDPGEWRYFAYMSLFTMSMIGLVMFDSLLLIYVFWEMVGLSSYLLIGFWFNRPSAAAAAKKAFLVTRLGDIGFLLAILLIYTETGTFNIPEIQELALAGAIGGTTLTLFALGLFAGAAGKSAQVPLHVWLPDAMEGPTPVSALIHAATMVAAGVYLVARMFPVFHESHDAMTVVGAIGGITAISAALIGIVQTDIKRVLAYSTISQLGYMMLALGSGAYVAAIFHLFTHAFFKALLFLGSGSVNHATNTFDMRLMGGLRKSMPITFWTFLIGSISLMGFFPFAGFWSKDEILSDTWAHEPYLFYIALVTAGITAFYMARVMILTFFGEYRGGAPKEDDGHTPHTDDAHAHDSGHGSTPHESPWSMALPLLVLAVPAIFAGFANINKDFEHLLVGAVPESLEIEESVFRLNIALVSTAVPLAGVVLAYLIYQAKAISSESLMKTFRPVHTLLSNRYYFDTLYERLITKRVFFDWVGGALSVFDRLIVDGAVNGVGRTTRQAGATLRYLQTGQFQTYGAIGFAGLLVTAVIVLVLNPV